MFNILLLLLLVANDCFGYSKDNEPTSNVRARANSSSSEKEKVRILKSTIDGIKKSNPEEYGEVKGRIIKYLDTLSSEVLDKGDSNEKTIRVLCQVIEVMLDIKVENEMDIKLLPPPIPSRDRDGKVDFSDNESHQGPVNDYDSPDESLEGDDQPQEINIGKNVGEEDIYNNPQDIQQESNQNESSTIEEAQKSEADEKEAKAGKKGNKKGKKKKNKK